MFTAPDPSTGQSLAEAGYPPGMLNVVTGLGEQARAAPLAHPGVDHVFFTGSRPVATASAKAAADDVVPVVLELGGRSPDLAFAADELHQAVGGWKRSGYGREKGFEGPIGCTRTETVAMGV